MNQFGAECLGIFFRTIVLQIVGALEELLLGQPNTLVEQLKIRGAAPAFLADGCRDKVVFYDLVAIYQKMLNTHLLFTIKTNNYILNLPQTKNTPPALKPHLGCVRVH